MIQRIQTLYLILAALLAGVVPFFLNLWVETENGRRVLGCWFLYFLSFF